MTIDLDAWEAVDTARGFTHETFQACISRLAREAANRVIEDGMRARQEAQAREQGGAQETSS